MSLLLCSICCGNFLKSQDVLDFMHQTVQPEIDIGKTKTGKKLPKAWIEHATLRSSVSRSPNWAISASISELSRNFPASNHPTSFPSLFHYLFFRLLLSHNRWKQYFYQYILRRRCSWVRVFSAEHQAVTPELWSFSEGSCHQGQGLPENHSSQFQDFCWTHFMIPAIPT